MITLLLSPSLLASVLYLNSMSVTWTARIQIFLTCSKLLALAIIIVPGMYLLFKGKTLSPFLSHYVYSIVSDLQLLENVGKRVIGITRCRKGLTKLWDLITNVSHIYRKAANSYADRAPTKSLHDAYCLAVQGCSRSPTEDSAATITRHFSSHPTTCSVNITSQTSPVVAHSWSQHDSNQGS